MTLPLVIGAAGLAVGLALFNSQNSFCWGCGDFNFKTL
jgi:hypothetical protein